MDWRQQTIQNIFGGDEKKFEKAYDEAAREAISEAVSWNDLQLNATVLTDLEETTQNFIENRLGYMAHRAVRLRFEPYLRALIQNYRQGVLSADEFSDQADEHIKLIRNQDMEHYSSLDHSEHYKDMYERLFNLYGLQAKERLTRFLGYEPELKHSLMAELWLWDIMSQDIRLGEKITAIDYKAITIIRYREILFSEGKVAADDSPLIPSIIN